MSWKTWVVLVVAVLAAAALPALSLAQSRDFKEQDLSLRDYKGRNLDGSDFTGATLHRTDLTGASMKGAKFIDTDMRATYMSRADVSGATFSGITGPFIVEETNFSKATLEGVDLKEADCFKCNFQGANLRNTKGWYLVTASDFRGADLRGANLAGAKVSGGARNLQLEGALYNSKTRFPQWLDPEDFGMKKAE